MLSYVEKTLESNKKFNERGLISENPSFEGRLKYWTNEMCAQNPHTFDFVITVSLRFTLSTTILTVP